MINNTNTFRNRLLVSTFLAVGLGFSMQANAEIWQDINAAKAKKTAPQSLKTQTPSVTRGRHLQLDKTELEYLLNQAPDEALGNSSAIVELPLPNGQLAKYRVFSSPVMAPSLARQYPDIKTYRVVDINNPDNTGRLDLTPDGFHGMLSQNGETIFIDPVGDNYQSYYKGDYTSEMGGKNKPAFNCGFHERESKAKAAGNMTRFDKAAYNRAQKPDVSFGTELRTYRLAVAATGEFTAFHGGTKEKAMAAIVTGINRVNQVYERDVAIKLELVANNSDIVYTDASSDPFTDNSADSLIEEVGKDINAKIGVANYDIGHVFSTGGGGLAGFGVVCGDAKAEGVTGSDSPINDPFFIDYVAHEIGHQFHADHTFNGSAGGCSGNRSDTAAYEPGSGSTIMAYASLCDDENLQSQSDVYFHTHSIAEISGFIANSSTGGSCGVAKSLNNAVPVPNAGSDGAIPKSTPFILTGTATDSNAGDNLTYAWEQYDLGPTTTSKASLTDDGKRPLFRSFTPTASPSRVFPKLGDVLSGSSTYGEVLPTTARDLNFRFTVRDGKGGVATDSLKLTVSADAGPFTVTAPSAAVSWAQNSVQTVSWDVANTTAAPINCAKVDIGLSTDGGQNFSVMLKSGAANDGSEQITVPGNATTNGRLRIKCTNQPFFAVNKGTITISGSGGGGGSVNTAPIANADSFTVQQDSGVTRFAVLDNDSDADGDTLTITEITNISNGGTATVNGTRIDYQPASGFSGVESFTYAVSDGKGGTATAKVSVTVNAVATSTNSAPTAKADTYSVDQDSTATDLNVLANDSDPDGDTLTITAVSEPNNGGYATIKGTAINYEPAYGYAGSETFTYTISDGKGGTDTASVTIDVKATSAPSGSSGGSAGGSTGGSTGGSGGGAGGASFTGGSSSGGGSFGLFTLLLLNLGRSMKAARIKRARKKQAQAVVTGSV